MTLQGFWSDDLEGTTERMNATLVQFTTTALRPAASAATEGMIHVATDSPFAISYDNGGAWVNIGATVPQGELGGTWAAPTVDGTHSGSAHHASSHTAASHSDQGATGAELETLTDGSDGDSLHIHPLKSQIVSFSRTAGAGAGSQAITGAGFAPKAAIIFAANASSDEGSWGFGDDGDGEAHIRLSGAVFQGAATRAVNINDGGGNAMDALIATFDSDGLTFTWAITGSGIDVDTGFILFLG